MEVDGLISNADTLKTPKTHNLSGLTLFFFSHTENLSKFHFLRELRLNNNKVQCCMFQQHKFKMQINSYFESFRSESSAVVPSTAASLNFTSTITTSSQSQVIFYLFSECEDNIKSPFSPAECV